MDLINQIKGKILNKSDMYQYYKNETHKLKSENHALENKLGNKDNLIKSLLHNDLEFDENFDNFCPICNTVIKFEPFGIVPRDNARCPCCNSLERHRFVFYIFYNKFSDVFEKKCKMLHFAPEPPLYNHFKQLDNIDYHTADLNPESYERRNIHITKKINMEDIDYDDETFDVIYNSHVLEHIPDDIKAMSELYRVLKDDGICFIMVPLYDIPETFENEEYNTPELRLKYFDQEDHLRKYGLDFKDRLTSVGFNVTTFKTEDFFDTDFKNKLYSIGKQTLFICTK